MTASGEEVTVTGKNMSETGNGKEMTATGKEMTATGKQMTATGEEITATGKNVTASDNETHFHFQLQDISLDVKPVGTTGDSGLWICCIEDIPIITGTASGCGW